MLHALELMPNIADLELGHRLILRDGRFWVRIEPGSRWTNSDLALAQRRQVHTLRLKGVAQYNEDLVSDNLRVLHLEKSFLMPRDASSG